MEYLIYNPKQISDISQLFRQTFTDSEGEAEGVLIGHLAYELLTTTAKNDLTAFVAMEGSDMAGCIIFTRLAFEKSCINAFMLAPVAVATSYQKQGVGQALIKFGLKQLKQQNIELVITYGDPNFYGKVGFNQISEDIIKAPQPLSYPHGWLAQSLTLAKIKPIKGASTCVKAFNNPQYW